MATTAALGVRWRIALNDAALVYEPESSARRRFRIGFLGCTWRSSASASSGSSTSTSSPRHPTSCTASNGGRQRARRTNPSEYPTSGKIANLRPIVDATIWCRRSTSARSWSCVSRRGQLKGMDYLSEDRVEIRYTLPMGEIMFDFDALKSRTKGYASLNYEPSGERCRPGQGRHPVAGRGRRRVQRDRPPRQRLPTASPWRASSRSSSPGSSSVPIRRHRCPDHRPRTSACARRWPSATAVTSPGASCWRSRRKARSG